ncbi:MAG: ligase-associated DNA damage response endonuclease PdeM [Phycisphaerales bacterium]
MPGAQVTLDGIDAELMPERALFLRAPRALVVADLHFGKSESYRQFGVPSADGIDEETLERLGRAAMRAGAKVIVVVGDLTHHADGIGEAEMERFARFRERIALPIRLVEGNHDRGVRALPPEWCIDCVGARFALGGVRFVHEPPDVGIAGGIAGGMAGSAAEWTVSGHLHPMLSVARGARSVEAPAFVIDRRARQLVLPAFSKFTRGVRFEPRAGTELFAIAEGAVVGPIGGGAARDDSARDGSTRSDGARTP